MKILASLILILLLSYSVDILAQKAKWQINISEVFYLADSLEGISDDSLIYTRTNYRRSVAIDQITEINKIVESKMGKSIMIGMAVVGLTAGLYGAFAIDPESENFPFLPTELLGQTGQRYVNGIGGFLIGSIVGGLVGTIVGAIISKDKVYDLNRLPKEEKLLVIQSLISERN